MSSRESDPLLLVQKPEHDPFSEECGDNGYPYVDIPACHYHPYPSILGKSLFGNIQPRHDLHLEISASWTTLGGVSIL